MGHTIPVFFIPIRRENIPDKLETWHDAELIISDLVENHLRDSFWVSSSRNWWHQDATVKICQHLGIPGLEFTLCEVSVLYNDEIQIAIRALNALLVYMSSGYLDLGPITENDGTLSVFTKEMVNNKVLKITKKYRQKAFDEAKATNDVDEGSAQGHQALVGYYSFLKSLHQAILIADEEKKCLLYVMPQP
jgi:hypothetical protein